MLYMKYPFVLPMLVLALFVGGCADLVAKLKGQETNAKAIVDAGGKTVTDLQAVADSLPPGPDKDAVVAKLVKAQKAVADANKFLADADVALTAFENGQIPQEVVGAVSPLPYGGYILFALGAIQYLRKSGEASKLGDAFTRVVTSWNAVGADLSPAEKKQVAAIQGPDVTALVHETKANLPAPA